MKTPGLPFQSTPHDPLGKEPPRSRRDHPATSREAEPDRKRLASLQETALALVRTYPGRTGREYDALHGGDYREIARRLPELKRRGLVKTEGRKTLRGFKPAARWWPVTDG